MSSGIGAVGSLTAEQVQAVLLAATAAPSLHNSQPWRFRCTPHAIELFADRSRAVPVADPEHQELMLACGAALLNLRLAIRVTGVYPDVRMFPDTSEPDLLATVRPAGHRPPTPADSALAAAIPRRHTNRRPFLSSSVPVPLRNQLRRAAEAERAWLAILERPQLFRLRTLLHQAHCAQLGDTGFVAEWQHWTGRDSSTREGVPACGDGPLPEPRDQWVLRDFSAGQASAQDPGEDFGPDPLIGVLGSFQDALPAQFQAGLAMQRVLLTATATGLSASFLSPVVEVSATRRELRTLLGGGLWPQTILRIGYGPPVPATPRRPLEAVVSDETSSARLGSDQPGLPR